MFGSFGFYLFAGCYGLCLGWAAIRGLDRGMAR